jgi:hypothetical protein
MPDKTAERCAAVFVNDWVLRLGPPEELLSDQGAQFESRLFQEMCKLLAVDKLRTTAYQPQCDGQTERANRSLLALLNKLPIDSPRNWDERLPFALAAYRSSVHSVTRMTPNRLMLGREVATPLIMLLPRPPGSPDLQPYCQQLHERFEDAHRMAVEAIKSQHKRTQLYLDSKSKMYSFKIGDRVWLYDPKPHKGVNRKLAKNCWSGWWTVTVVVSPCVYVIKYRDTKIKRTVNADTLEPYTTRSFDRFPPRTAREQDVEGEGERRDGEGSDEDYWEDPERDMSEGVGDGEPGSGPGDLTYHTRPQPLTQRPRRRPGEDRKRHARWRRTRR